MLECSLGGQALGDGAGEEGRLGLWLEVWAFLGHYGGGPRGLENSSLYPCHVTTTSLISWLNYRDQDV